MEKGKINTRWWREEKLRGEGEKERGRGNRLACFTAECTFTHTHTPEKDDFDPQTKNKIESLLAQNSTQRYVQKQEKTKQE